jgi:uncharacterized membrane protein
MIRIVVHTKSLFYKLSDLLDDNTCMLWFLFYVFYMYRLQGGDRRARIITLSNHVNVTVNLIFMLFYPNAYGQ